MIQPAQRMDAIPPYFFAQLGRRIAALRAEGHDVIRMDMGSPDLAPADHILQALVQSARNPDHHGYTPFGGTDSFKRAVADYYSQRFGVELEPAQEVLGLIGSKEGLFHVAQSFVNPGDVVLVPDPGYPVYTTGARFAGGEVHYMPLLAENDFLPDLEAIPDSIRERAKLMWLNYPNNPTGATAELTFFERAVAFARENQILLCHDAPYMEVCFDGYQAHSALEVQGAREVVVEFNSLSKSYNMAGWRLGMAVGETNALEAMYTLKSQVDTSHFRAALDAGVAALEGDQGWLEERNRTYQQRRDLVIEALRAAGLIVDPPAAAMYVWARLPETEESAAAYCERMLDEIGVSITPGSAFGDTGEGYVRVSLATPTEKVKQAMDRIAAWS